MRFKIQLSSFSTTPQPVVLPAGLNNTTRVHLGISDNRAAIVRPGMSEASGVIIREVQWEAEGSHEF
eukprot:CAMPEP_0182500946 /NCGR_PEP_ID=MMETSP1321-20130603/10337_1 /TAXON_ID=91990 /ORGANISM="Bolidomonas sp., Strain RCC1657" /LENGTH=66 /DNA_ID=CAMNT_0024705525 /DNA_START=66 /DNA_END=266 /DNA_ORIENTATION=-